MTFHDADDDSISSYVAGTLKGDEEAMFERHLLECAACREEVRLGTAIRSAIRKRRPGKQVWAVGGAALAAAGLLIAFAVTRPSGIDRLANVSTPPVYAGIPIRSLPGAGTEIFEAGMSEYRRGSYADAALTFERARNAGSDSVVTTFFRASSLMLSGRTDGAANEFRRVTRYGPSAYLGESHYYLAKALLKAGRVDEALKSLSQASSIEGPVQRAAGALADSVVRLR